MDTLTKKDLASTLARKLGFKKAQAQAFTDVFFDTLKESLVESNRVEIRGFGTWEVKWMGARPNARNPKTGERVYVPPRKRVSFRPGKILRETLCKPLPVADRLTFSVATSEPRYGELQPS